MKFKYTLFAGFAITVFAFLAVSFVVRAQETSTSTGATIPPVSPVMSTSTLPQEQNPLPRPEPTLFNEEQRPTSTEQTMSSSTKPEPKPSNPSVFKQDDAEQMIADKEDSPAIRALKMARYWSLYRETGSEKIYAITTSNTKREIKTLAFFSAFEVNFGIKLMPKGSLDQFADGDAITSTEGLDPKSFRKAPQPCRLIKTADKPVVYLACLGVKRAIQNEKAFRQFGWDFQHVRTVDAKEADGMKTGDAVSESTVFDQGVQIDISGIKLTPQKTEQKTTGPSASANTQTKGMRVVKVQGSTKLFLITADGKRHYLANMDVIRSLKLDLSKAQVITTEQLSQYPEGESISVGVNTTAPMNTEKPQMPSTGANINPPVYSTSSTMNPPSQMPSVTAPATTSTSTPVTAPAPLPLPVTSTGTGI